MKYKNVFIGSTLLFLAFFVVDTVYELFQIKGSSNVTTVLGLKIQTVVTSSSLQTTFRLTVLVLFSYIIFVLFSLSVMYLKQKFVNDRK